MEDVPESFAAPDPFSKSGTSDVPAGATGTVSFKSTLDYVATTTPPPGFTGTPPQGLPNGLPKSRQARFDKTAPKRNTGPRSKGAGGAARSADFLTAGADDSDAVVGFNEPTTQANASCTRCETGEDDSLASTLNLLVLTPNDWQMLRAARLRALLDSPQAFTSTYARESGWGELDWRRTFDPGIWIVAQEAENVIGIASSVRAPERPATRHLESIWTAPTHRRRGVFRALLRAVAEIESLMRVTELLLWVLEGNHAAQRAYEALGFEPTGERQLLPAFGRFERRLRLVLGRLQDSDPARRSFGVDHPGTELGQRPGFEFEEIQGLAGAAHIVDTA